MNRSRKRSHLRNLKQSKEFKAYKIDILNLRTKWQEPETPEKFKEFIDAFIAEKEKLEENEAIASGLAKWINTMHDQKVLIIKSTKSS